MDDQEKKTFLDKLKALDHNKKIIICSVAAIILMVCMIAALVSCRNQDLPEETTPSTSATEESTEAPTEESTEAVTEEPTESATEEATEATDETEVEENDSDNNGNSGNTGNNSGSTNKPSTGNSGNNSANSGSANKPNTPNKPNKPDSGNKPNKPDPKPTNPPAPKPTDPPAPKPTDPPAPKPTDPPAPQPTDPPVHQHSWKRVDHPEEGHWYSEVVCDCGAHFKSEAEYMDHVDSIQDPAEAIINHGGWGTVDEWIVDKPGYSEWVCSGCGAVSSSQP